MKIPAASTFINRAVAETIIATALEANGPAIANFLSGTADQLIIEYNAGRPIGYVMNRGSTITLPTSDVRIVLRRDPNMSIGYRIQTGYPMP